MPAKLLMWRTRKPKFWPKKPVITMSGRASVAITVSRWMTTLSRFETVERYTSIAPVSKSL